MYNYKESTMKTRVTIGVIIIFIGIGMLIDQMSVWSFWGTLGDWWPIILVIIGVVNLTKNPTSLTFGIVVTAIGLLLLASNLDLIPLTFWDMFWPVMLILLGIALLSRYQGKRKSKFNDELDIFTVFSGAEERLTIDDFRGGSVFTVFGGSEIDLSESMMAPEGAKLELTAIFGGIELIVPSDWNVRTKGIPFLGALSNSTHKDYSADVIAPILNINYTAIFGGIEVTNKKHKN